MLLSIVVTLIYGCATSPKIKPVRIGDNELTKEQLIAEIQKLDESQKMVESNKGVTGTNVASVLFWWPGLLYTYYDAGEANRLIEQRRAHLTMLYNQKLAQKHQKTTKSS
jgi:hypothetical protein